jgi:hypothetical protein
MDKIQELYNLYLSKGLITEATTLEKFQSANTEQASKLYDLGKKNGLFEKTDQQTFLTVWQPVKKKNTPVSDSTAPNQELASEQQDGSLATQQPNVLTAEELDTRALGLDGVSVTQEESDQQFRDKILSRPKQDPTQGFFARGEQNVQQQRDIQRGFSET